MPYMTNGKRDYKKEDKWDASHKGRLQEREARHRARALFEKQGKVHKGDNKQVDHIKPLNLGGSKTDPKNLRVLSVHANESYARTKTGGVKPTAARKGKGK